MLTLVLWVVLIMARGLLYGVGAAVHHREATGLGAVLVALALSFAAQNTVTALRMKAAPPLPGGQQERIHARHERIHARRQERRERREARG